MPTTTVSPAVPDLSAFLLAHAGFRVEFGRLADALPRPRDAAHAALLEDQLDFLLAYLHHHHSDEDAVIWPWLRERAPRSAPLLDVLEEQHEQIDPDVALAGDRARSVSERAAALARLHLALNRHLDDEERTAVPLIHQHITVAEWIDHGKAVVRSYDKKRLPLLFGWACGAGSPALAAAALAEFPLPIRVLFKLVWWPAYRRRHEALYGMPLRQRIGQP